MERSEDNVADPSTNCAFFFSQVFFYVFVFRRSFGFFYVFTSGERSDQDVADPISPRFLKIMRLSVVFSVFRLFRSVSVFSLRGAEQDVADPITFFFYLCVCPSVFLFSVGFSAPFLFFPLGERSEQDVADSRFFFYLFVCWTVFVFRRLFGSVSVFSPGERSEEDVADPWASVQLRGAGEPTGRVLRGPVCPNGFRRRHLLVSFFFVSFVVAALEIITH